MRAKQHAEAQRAQLVESFVLLAAVAWATWLASWFYEAKHDDDAIDKMDTQDALLMGLLPRVLHVFNAVSFAAVARALLSRRPVSSAVEELSRHERDSGLAVGCILPPLVMLSRFLAIAHGDSASVSGPTLLYTWIAVTASASTLIKIACFGSCGVRPTAVVDVVVLPLVFSMLGVESDLRFALPTIARSIIAVVFHFGRLALRRSFTVGEALIVAQAVGVGILDLALITGIKLSGEPSSFPDRVVASWHLHASPIMEREPHQLALQVGVLGTLLVCAALTPLLKGYGSPSPHIVAAPLPLLETLQFVAIVVVVLGGLVYPWASVLLDTWNPVAWLVEFVLEKPVRGYLLVYWVVCLAVCVPAFAVMSRQFSLRQIIARKLFHALVVMMFVPAYFQSPEMLSLSYGVAAAVFCLAECVRAVALPPLGQQIATFVKPFIDHREGGRVILTHTYLLLGCAMPLWLAHSTDSTNALAANAGVLALGVGDAMGAVVGSTLGRYKIFGGKTIEGTAAVMVSMTLASLALHDYHSRALTNGDFVQLAFLFAGAALTSLLEASTAQIDNLVLSLFLTTIANLIACHA